MTRGLQIGVVAQRTGFSVDAIRFYEREGLLKAPLRSEGGFRIFGVEDVEDLRLIRSAKEFGFSLNEIRELLTPRHGAPEPCPQVEQLLATKLNAVKEKLTALQTLEVKLSEALEECRRACCSNPPQQEAPCPVLEEITHGESTR